jgi:cytochrome b6-f complex iron-sulfur subunit
MSNDDDSEPQPPRRDFLGVAIAGATAALGAAAGYPVVKFLDFRERRAAEFAQVGRLDDFPSGTSKTVLLGDRPALVIRLANGELRAFSALCSHLQCVVAYSSERDRIECPCHRGVYNTDGKVVSGPPPRPLQALRVETQEGVVVVSET